MISYTNSSTLDFYRGEGDNWLWDKIALKIMQFSLGRCAR